MITRVWHGRTRSTDAGRYLQFLHDSGIKDYIATPGNREVKIWRKTEGEITHFWTISVWDSLESIKAFAGEDVERARYYPEDKDFLLEFEPKVQHYECFNIK